tara:strand:+ start:191 stop:439 length:249 start_codon:yes stop_codon:yes gene_type:complete
MPAHDGGRLAVRLDVLSREQLLALAAAGCATDAKLCARADALIAEANPLPSCCVDRTADPDRERERAGRAGEQREGDSRICT